jgi:hypothetical protein
MPVFLTDMVARGFWWAWLASIIFIVPFGILGLILQMFNKVLGTIIQCVPSVFFTFYIWNIRGHIFWLVWAILSIILTIIVIGKAIMDQ